MITKVNISFDTDGMAARLAEFKPGGAGYNTVLREVATSMSAVIRTRIHEEGLAADGSDIGQYNMTDPLYVNPDNSPKAFPVQGKTGKKVFKTGIKKGQPHATRYFSSYNDFKTFIGRNELGKVNLSLSGQMASQFVVIATENGYGLGWPDEEKYYRALHFETKYGKPIWALSDSEKQQVTDIAQEATIKFLGDAIS